MTLREKQGGFVCARVEVPRGGLVREQVIRYGRARVRVRARAQSSDGQVYHAYLKGHSITVGPRFAEPLCGLREENRSGGELKSPQLR